MKKHTLTRNLLESANTLECARWLAKHVRMTTVDALFLFRRLERNEEFEFSSLDELGDLPKGLKCVTEHEVPTVDERSSECDQILDLAKRGVEGDTDAAMRICKLVISGELAVLYMPYA